MSEQPDLREALSGILDMLEPECRYDHHGNCQAHYVEKPCRVAEARAALGVPVSPEGPREREVADALAAVGLPPDASVEGLIRHHRNNEAAASGGWKLAYDNLVAKGERPDLRAALEAAERVKASAIENGGRLTPGAILDVQAVVNALSVALRATD